MAVRIVNGIRSLYQRGVALISRIRNRSSRLVDEAPPEMVKIAIVVSHDVSDYFHLQVRLFLIKRMAQGFDLNTSHSYDFSLLSYEGAKELAVRAIAATMDATEDESRALYRKSSEKKGRHSDHNFHCDSKFGYEEATVTLLTEIKSWGRRPRYCTFNGNEERHEVLRQYCEATGVKAVEVSSE